MKSIDIFWFRYKTLCAKQLELQAAYEDADEADRLAWKIYEGLDEETYWANPKHYDEIVRETSEKVKTLRGHLASLEDAITHANRLAEELQYLEDEGVL